MSKARSDWSAITVAFAAWLRRAGLANKLAVVLVLAAGAAFIATYALLTEATPLGKNTDTLTWLLTIDIILVLALGALIARRIAVLVLRRRQNKAGSRLHLRLVAIFSALAVTPAILVAIFASTFMYLGIQGWFSDRVRMAVNESLAVAQGYLDEHKQVIRADVLAMANDLNREGPRLIGVPERFAQVVSTQAALRSLTEALVFDGSGRVLARAGLSFALEFEPIPDEALNRARNGEVVLLVGEGEDRVRALLRLDRLLDTYLFVGRLIEPKVLAHMERAQGAVQEYRDLELRRFNLQVMVTLLFIVVALLLLLAAVWFGLNFATRLIRPIGELINAAERVRAGDLSARVDVPTAQPSDELSTLTRTFNRMTEQLEGQRNELIDANRMLDTRRRFTEAVLAGVSAGVLSLDAQGQVTSANLSALKLLGLEMQSALLLGHNLQALSAELENLRDTASKRESGMAEAQIEIVRHGSKQTLYVRITTERDEQGHVAGFVLTFDDITALTSAQRQAAWGDVARRIAHEIKNPLTPIQLSAERLRRKYLKEIHSDPETFTVCVDTIIRQVDDIGRMVDEFSAFARMPAPTIKSHNLTELVRQQIFLIASAGSQIEFKEHLPQGPLWVECDARQIAQALTNLLKNAAESIEGREAADHQNLPRGLIEVLLLEQEQQIVIAVADNGKGLPEAERDRLTEPYVTTRSKGTGLGLAIVKKIMEDHHGRLELSDRPPDEFGGGAVVSLLIPKNSGLSNKEVQKQAS